MPSSTVDGANEDEEIEIKGMIEFYKEIERTFSFYLDILS